MKEKIVCCQCGNLLTIDPEELQALCPSCQALMRLSWDEEHPSLYVCELCNRGLLAHGVGQPQPPLPVKQGEAFCPKCKKSLSVDDSLREFLCPHCGVSLTAEAEQEAQRPMQVLSCALCRELLELPINEPLERFPCPHCEGLLEYVSQDPYRNNTPQVSSPRCDCGGILRFSRGEEPLLNIGGVLGLGAVNLDRLLAAGGAPRESAPLQCYRCEDCGKVKQLQSSS